MKVTSYRPYPARPAAAVEKSAFAAAFLSEERLSAAEVRPVGGNTDQLQISNPFPRTEIEKAAASAAQTLSQPTDAGRLEQLRSAVQSGSYYVPSDRLADAMMSWRIL